jgi:hypothetical protein
MPGRNPPPVQLKQVKSSRTFLFNRIFARIANCKGRYTDNEKRGFICVA